MNPADSTSTIAGRLDVKIAAVDTSRETPASVHTTPHGETSETKIGEAQAISNRPAGMDGVEGDVGDAVTARVQLDDASAAISTSAAACCRLRCLASFTASASPRGADLRHDGESAVDSLRSYS
ncbi:MAG: hypothetical protein AB7U83_09870 [Vicinamibacterales bacterium]